MSEENNIVLPATIKAHGSDKTIEIDTSKWENAQGMVDYLLTYACGVIMQRASAGKNDDPEKAAKAVDKAIERLETGIVPSGGGFTKLSPEDYALKEVIMSQKVKFEKGESVSDCLKRLATGLTPFADDVDEAEHDKLYGKDETYTDARNDAIADTKVALQTELEASEVYKSALKARKAKAKTTAATGSLMGKIGK